MQVVFNEAFEKESSSDDDMFGDEIEVDRSHIQRLKVRLDLLLTYSSYLSFQGCNQKFMGGRVFSPVPFVPFLP